MATRRSRPRVPRCSERRSRRAHPTCSRRRSKIACTSRTALPAAPLLAAVREDPPASALGSTLSGSGPTVIVWARAESARACAQELEGRFPDVSVLTLSVSREGAHAL